MSRVAEVSRKTTETDITLEFNLDGSGNFAVDTSVPFLDHMLSLMAKHGLFDLKIKAKGDIEIDFHHTVEDVGICLGEALKKALGKKEGIKRYGYASVPMMEALATVVLDLSDRPMVVYKVDLPKEKVGSFDGELTEEFIRAFATNGGINLHINLITGSNMHHIIEAIFKALGRALDYATKIDDRIKGVLSTKGKL